MSSSTKKYKLFSPQGNEKAPCAFFLSDKGCRNGDNCKFAHVAANGGGEDKVVQAKTIVETGSVVSSESEDEKDNVVMKDGENGSGKKRKNRRGKSTESPFANPKKAKTTTPPPAVPTSSTKTPAPTTPEKKSGKKAAKEKQEKPAEPKAKQDKPAEATTTFRALNLPVASFSLPSANENTREKVQPVAAETKPTEPPPKNTSPLPTNTPTGRKWLKLVEKTRTHHKYASEFNFDKYMQADKESLGEEATWFRAKPYGKWCKNNPQAIVMDCEMCQTKDPATGNTNNRALCRISVVDVDTDEVLLDSLVKPDDPVTDYRTRINGIKEDHLKDVEFTLKHAQEFMAALCSEETIIMGHSVNNDLAAIRMEHYCIIDSACLFKASDSETATVGLKDLSMTILKKPMPETHDSVNDSRVALRCLEYYLKNDGKVDPIVRTPKKKSTAPLQLFVHRIPKAVQTEHLMDLFLQHTSVAAESVDDITFSGELGKTHITFKTREHANLAFHSLDGKAEEEGSGRLQKKVFLKTGGYIRVRKMVKEREPASFSEAKEIKSP